MNENQREEKMFESVTIDSDDFSCLPQDTIYKEFIKEAELKIPKPKPKIEQLSKIISRPAIISYKTILTPEGRKVIFQGKIKQKIFYVADKPEQSVHAASFQIPFCNFIKLPKSFKIKDIKIKIEEIIVQVVNQKKINKCILLLVAINPQRRCHDC